MALGGFRRAFGAEPWHYQLSLVLLASMLLTYAVKGATSREFMLAIVVTIGWFVLYGFVILCGILARAENAFWERLTEPPK